MSSELGNLWFRSYCYTPAPITPSGQGRWTGIMRLGWTTSGRPHMSPHQTIWITFQLKKCICLLFYQNISANIWQLTFCWTYNIFHSPGEDKESFGISDFVSRRETHLHSIYILYKYFLFYESCMDFADNLVWIYFSGGMFVWIFVATWLFEVCFCPV